MKNKTPPMQKYFIAAATIGIAGWVFIIVLLGVWYLAPVAIPTVKQPLPILNADHKIAIGEPIILQLNVIKLFDTEVQNSNRFITCNSGNLITLTGTPTDLPVGAYTIISDNIILPPKVIPGDTCKMNYRVTYRFNPVRTEVLNLSSEPFTVMEKKG